VALVGPLYNRPKSALSVDIARPRAHLDD